MSQSGFVFCLNGGAVSWKSPKQETVADSTMKAKHILRRYHLLREINERGDIHIYKVHTDDNVADPLTKALSQQKHEGHTSSMGIRYLGNWL